MSFIMRPVRFASSGFIIEGSGVHTVTGTRSGLTATIATTRSSARIFTMSLIIKRVQFGVREGFFYQQANGNNENAGLFEFDASDRLSLKIQQVDSGTIKLQRITTQVFRDPSAWMHIHIAVNTGLTTDACCKIHINGTEITAFGTKTNIDSARDHGFLNSSKEVVLMGITDVLSGSATEFQQFAYMARVFVQDGVYGVPTDVGEVTDDGFWQINDASGLTFGNNGFLLEGGVNISRGTDTQAGGTFAQQKTEFLSHFDGSDAATSSTDVSLAARTLTFNGNAQLDTAQKYFGTASLLLDGTADSVSAADNPAYDIAALDFTMDAWIRLASDASGVIMSKWGVSGQRGWLFSYDADNSNLDWRTSTNGSNNANQVNETWNPDADTWYHVAAERTGGKVHLYVDGTMLGSGTSNSDNVYANTAKFEVGSCENTGALTFNGHIDEPRYVRGVGLYGGSNFTPETAAYTNPATANPFIVTGTITATNSSPTNGDA